jgi:glycosyltransferase involved in cell wall biosynthesis
MDVTLLKKKHIVMVLSHDAIYPTIDARVNKEAKSLIQANFKVTIVCRVSEKGNTKPEIFKGIRIVRVFCEHPELNKPRFIRLISNLKNARKLSKTIIHQEPDIIHCHDLNALLEGAFAAAKINVPLVYDAHEDWLLFEYTKSNYSKLVYLLTKIYEQILLMRVSNKIMANPGQTRLYNPKDTIFLLNCPRKDFMKNSDPRSIKKKYKLDKKIVISYHGLVGKTRGILEIISAAEKLIKKYDNLMFLIVGHNYESFLEIVKEKSLEKYFIFTGRTHYSEIPDYLKASDISYSVLHPTKQYVITAPTKIFEGMSAGVPIIANKEFFALKEIVEKNNTGILVNLNLEEIIMGLEKLIKDKNLRMKMGRNGKLAVEREYTWEKQAENLVEFYNKIFSKL